jgi:hypothetical protein
MAHLTNAQIRALVLATIADACAIGRNGMPRSNPLVRGPNWVRQGRWVLCDTLTAGVFIACRINAEGDGAAAYAGPAATIRNLVPAAVREAWLAGQYGETDVDPAGSTERVRV